MPPSKTIDELLREVQYFHQSGRLEEAAQSCRAVLRLKPNHPALTGLLGVLRVEQSKWDDAERVLEKACRLNPNGATEHFHRGLALRELGRSADAIAMFERCYAIDPSYPLVLSEIENLLLGRCDWRDFDARSNRMTEAARSGKAALAPFQLLLFSDDPADLLNCAKSFAAHSLDKSKLLVPSSRYEQGPVRRDRKIRVAYQSADFRDHAVAHVISELIELHDRSRFEIVAISIGPDDESEQRRRLESSFDRFVDALDWPVNEVSQRIHALDIDIFVDLMGHTKNSRLHYLACHPAKIQVSFLGYPGTTGAEFMDYIIADPFIVEPDQDVFFSEKVVRLPDSYLVQDRRRPFGETQSSRAQYGLPEDGFVFCSFSNAGKLNPACFDVWMRLLRAVPGSVLWLSQLPATAVENLRKEAAARGVDPARLIFAPRAPLGEYMGRHRLADLCLDTFPYNAHSTAGDALWAGVPIVTCPGRSFAARVCGSLLKVVDMPELIVESMEEYEALTLALVHDRERLSSLRRRLEENRDRARLFDTPRFCRNLERAFETMVEIQRAGEKPRAFAVEPAAN